MKASINKSKVEKPFLVSAKTLSELTGMKNKDIRRLRKNNPEVCEVSKGGGWLYNVNAIPQVMKKVATILLLTLSLTSCKERVVSFNVQHEKNVLLFNVHDSIADLNVKYIDSALIYMGKLDFDRAKKCNAMAEGLNKACFKILEFVNTK